MTPPPAFNSTAPFLVGLPNCRFRNGKTPLYASKALGAFAKKHPATDGAIYRLTLGGWEIF